MWGWKKYSFLSEMWCLCNTFLQATLVWQHSWIIWTVAASTGEHWTLRSLLYHSRDIWGREGSHAFLSGYSLTHITNHSWRAATSLLKLREMPSYHLFHNQATKKDDFWTLFPWVPLTVQHFHLTLFFTWTKKQLRWQCEWLHNVPHSKILSPYWPPPAHPGIPDAY